MATVTCCQDIVIALFLNSIEKPTGMLIDGEIAIDMLELDDVDGNIYAAKKSKVGLKGPTAPG